MAEQRRSPRIRLNAWIDVAGSRDILLFHKIRDLSLGGVAVETGAPEPVGSKVDLLINFPELDETIQACGTVIRVQKDPWQGMVIRFDNLSEEAREVLKKYLGLRDASQQESQE